MEYGGKVNNIFLNLPFFLKKNSFFSKKNKIG